MLKITDGVMRHLAVRRPKPGATPTAPPPSADREQEYAEPGFEQPEATVSPADATVSSSDASLEPGSSELPADTAEQASESDEPERRDE